MECPFHRGGYPFIRQFGSLHTHTYIHSLLYVCTYLHFPAHIHPSIYPSIHTSLNFKPQPTPSHSLPTSLPKHAPTSPFQHTHIPPPHSNPDPLRRAALHAHFSSSPGPSYAARASPRRKRQPPFGDGRGIASRGFTHRRAGDLS